MSTAESIQASPPSRPLLLRLLRQLALLGISIGFGLIGSLYLFTLFPSVQPFFRAPQLPSLHIDMLLGLALLALTPVAIGYAFRRVQLNAIRGWVILGVVTAAVLVADLVLISISPSVAGVLESFLGVAFWKVHGLFVALSAVNLFAAIAAAWQLRPSASRRLVQFGLILAALFTLDLVLVAFRPSILDGLWDLPFTNRSFDRNFEALKSFVLLAAVVGLPPIVLLIAAWRWRGCSWRWIAGGYLLLAPVLAYLATDDPVIRRPMTMEEIAPAFPGAEESFAVLMRYGRQHPLGRDFRSPSRIWRKPMAPGEALEPRKPLEWQAWLTGRRSEIEADWAELAPVRAWWSELNAFDRIGDLTPARFDVDILSFQAFRTLAQHGCAIASLQALDGHGDEAVDTLLPILQVGRKLQPSARLLVRQMIGIVIERMSVDTATFILDRAAVSPAARERLAAALTAGGGGAPGARRLIAIEYAFQFNVMRGKRLGDLIAGEHSSWLRYGMNAIGPFVFNSRATFNIYGDFVADEQELVANRQFDQLELRTQAFFTQEARPRFKNFAGKVLIGTTIPAISKVAESYWRTQDARAALLERLARS